MRTEQDLRHYQVTGVEHAVAHPYAGLFLQMGLGKTITTLTAIVRLQRAGQVRKVLIVAPKRVSESVWHTEAANWTHTAHLTFSHVLGNERKRKAALEAEADIYLINRENVAWLQSHWGGAFPMDMMVIDELSSFKSHTSARFKALKIMRPRIPRLIGLTGTPMPNSLLDLWPQVYLLDMGERLGRTIGHYRDKYFIPNQRNGQVVYNYKVRKPEDAEVFGDNVNELEIFNKIGDICISMKTEDYLELPKRLDQLVEIDMPADIRKQYDDFEETQVLAMRESLQKDIDTSGTISAVNAAALTGKLLQFCNGAVYKEDRSYVEVHALKLDALAEDLEASQGDPFLLFYQYQHDVDRIQRYLKAFNPHLMDRQHTLRDVEKWNAGEIPFMMLHTKSGGHGLNLQYGGHVMGWFGRPWSLEDYQQGVARVDRQGQTKTVVNRTYLMRGTMEEDVIKSLDLKDSRQIRLMEAIKARIEKYL